MESISNHKVIVFIVLLPYNTRLCDMSFCAAVHSCIFNFLKETLYGLSDKNLLSIEKYMD